MGYMDVLDELDEIARENNIDYVEFLEKLVSTIDRDELSKAVDIIVN